MKIPRKVAVVLIGLLLMVTGCVPTTQEVKKQQPKKELYWPKPPAKPRIKFLATYRGSKDLKGSDPLMRFLGEERVFNLLRPHGIVADRDGNIYVSDIGLNRLFILKFDFRKKRLRILGKDGPVKVLIPLGLAIDDDRGLLYVADNGVKAVLVLDKETGAVKNMIGKGKFKNPDAVAVDPSRNRIYIADSKLQVVMAFDYDGKLIWKIGKGVRSNADDGFNVPAAMTIDRDGNLYVADMFNRYVKVFSPEGKFIKKIGYGLGMSSGQFSKLVGVALDSDGHIYALDTDFCNFQIFDQENNLLLFVGAPGRAPGHFLVPSEIFIDEKDRIYVTDTFNHRIQVFQYLKEGKK